MAPGGGLEGPALGVLEFIGWEVLFSTLLFVVVVGLCFALRQRAPALRYALWGLVLLRLVLPVDLSSPLSPASLAAGHLAGPGGGGAWLDVWPAAAEPDAYAPEGAAAEATGRGGTDGADWPWQLVAVWICGVAVVGGGLARRRAAYRRLVSRSEAVEEERVLEALERWRRELGVRRRVRVVSGQARQMPFTLGIVRPAIFVPRVLLEQGGRAVIEAVIAHELAHVRRCDDLLLMLQTAVSALYFFHPVAWWSAARMREASERICDAMVVGGSRLSPERYGRSLLAVLRLGLAKGPALAPGMDNSRKRFEMRLRSIMTRSSGRAGRRPLAQAVPAFVLGVFLLPMAANPERPGPSVPQTSGAGAADARQEISLSNPLPNARITSHYGPTTNPFTGQEAHHRGIDVAGPPGSAIFAPADGVVEEATADYSGGEAHGTVVVLDHGDGVRTFYSHLDRLDVTPGQRVSRGEVLGMQGSTGRVTGPHLHFEVWVNGEPRDPALYVSDWR